MHVYESATLCEVVMSLLKSGEIMTKWDFLEDYNTLSAEVEGVPPPPGLKEPFARVVALCACTRLEPSCAHAPLACTATP